MSRGFTLIELLVVIAIIEILAAILFPVFAQAKNAAKKTASLNNIKQASLSGVLYMQDYDDVIFPATASGTRADGLGQKYGSACFGPEDTAVCRFGYPLLVQEYARSTDIFLCPNDRAEDPLLGGRFDKRNEIYWYVYGQYPSYGMNVDYLNTYQIGPSGAPERYGKPASSISSQSTTILFAEATAKDFASPGRAVIANPVGYYQIIPPSGGHSFTGAVNTQYAWSNFPSEGDARGQGQLWGRFNPKSVLVGWLDGHVKVNPISRLNPGGASIEEMDRYYNGLDQ
jgi:prepilin-type N-terminal cleavage/methylation domain-containing protein